MTLRSPRIVLAAAVALLVGVLALFTLELSSTHAAERRQAERRFADKATVSASLTGSIFASSAGQDAARNAQSLGGARVDQAALERLARRSQLLYSVVLDADGMPLATTAGMDPGVLRRLAFKPQHLRDVLQSGGYRISGLVTPGTLEYVASFDTRHGRRVIVEGFPARLFGAFLSGYLRGLPDARGVRAYVVDTAGRVIASPVAGQQAAAPVRETGLARALKAGSAGGSFEARGAGHVYATGAVEHSAWRVVIAQRASALYGGGGTLQWLLLVVLAVVGAAAVALLHRTVRGAADLRHAYADLEQTNTELARSNVELKRSSSELEHFASVASHDLQEPLRKVQTFGDQLERRYGDEMPDEAKDHLRRMRRAAGRMSTLIEDLLRFSRVTTHARPPRAVDLDRVAREVAHDLEGLAAETQGRVDIRSLPAVEADPLQMRQLLQNLIGNGLKFHRPGEPPVVCLEEVPVAREGEVAFTVTDNGIGFEPVYAERIFRILERLHPRDVYDGTGIGLALCRKIVERHGGAITAEAAVDRGARFTVRLPLVQPDGFGPGHGAVDADELEPAHA